MSGRNPPSPSSLFSGAFGHPSKPLTTNEIELIRAQQPGGELMSYVQTRQITWWERTFRILAPRGTYSAVPSDPLNFTLGSYRVNQGQVLVVVDYAFNIYTFSGIAPNDFVPIEPNRLSTQVMWDIKVDSQREGQNIQHQVIPQQQAATAQPFAPNNLLAPAENWQFEAVRASQQQGPGGAALSGMPQRRHRDGLVKISNQYVVRSSNTLSAECAIINAIPIPVVFFEVNLAGILMAQNDYDAYQAANVPTGNPQVTKLVPEAEPQ